MIDVKYGFLPTNSLCNYFEFLINKIYKILPMREDNSKTLKIYLEGLLRELIGNKELVSILANEPRFVSVLNSIQFLILEEYSVQVYKKEVFKCIHILSDIKTSYFKEGDSDE